MTFPRDNIPQAIFCLKDVWAFLLQKEKALKILRDVFRIAICGTRGRFESHRTSWAAVKGHVQKGV